MVDAADIAIAQRLDPLLKLDPKQRAFAIHYSKHANAAEAARKAGYAKSSVYTTGSRLLQRQDIQDALQELWVAESITAGITPERVATEVASIAFNRSGETQDRDRLKALELLSRYLGLFNDKLQISYDDPDIIEAANTHGVTPQQLVAEMAQLAPIDTDS